MVLRGLARDAVTYMTDSKCSPLKPLNPESYLNKVKLAQIGRLATEKLLLTLLPPGQHCLKTRPDGTILEGHRRIHILRLRGVDVDGLPREVVTKE